MMSREEKKGKVCYCPYCNSACEPIYPFCGRCGAPIKICNRCGEVLRKEATVCTRCMAKMD